MSIRIGIMTVRDSGYHPNHRLLEAIHTAGHEGVLIHPYRLWPETTAGRLSVTAKKKFSLPQVVIPRQGAEIGESSLALIRQFQIMGVPLVNTLTAITIARNKFSTQQVLLSSGLPCLDTIFINDAKGIFYAVQHLGGYPVVAKSTSGRQGSGVLLIQNPEDAHQNIPPALKPREGLMIQRYLPPKNRRDLRALVVGGQCIAAVTLAPVDGEFRANFHLGAELRAVELPFELQKIAVESATAVGCDVAGVDMMVDVDNRPVIVEINYSPGFKGLESATGLDIAGEIVQFAINRFYESRK